MRETTIKDDLTGTVLASATETTVTVGTATGKLDLGADALAALVALANGEGPAKLWALAPVTAPPAKSRSKSRAKTASGNKIAADGSDAETVRTWAKENSVAVSERGRVGKDTVKAYDAAHPAGTAASAPQSPAPATDAGKATTGKPDAKKSLASV